MRAKREIKKNNLILIDTCLTKNISNFPLRSQGERAHEKERIWN
jgi:hypothetical protein